MMMAIMVMVMVMMAVSLWAMMMLWFCYKDVCCAFARAHIHQFHLVQTHNSCCTLISALLQTPFGVLLPCTHETHEQTNFVLQDSWPRTLTAGRTHSGCLTHTFKFRKRKRRRKKVHKNNNNNNQHTNKLLFHFISFCMYVFSILSIWEKPMDRM